MRSLFLLSVVLALPAAAAEPQVVLLWPGGAPGSEGKTSEETVRIQNGEHIVSGIHKPSLTVYLPPAESATGAGVVIAPGGSHVELWMDHEGHNVARWLSAHGVAGFILKYRLSREKGSTYQLERESLPDIQRAMRLVRSRAVAWSVDPARVGVIGFSAGGGLAALAGSRHDEGLESAADPVDRFSSKPAFQALIYPGIPAGLQPSKDAPPAFLACGEKDNPRIAQGLAELYLAFQRAGASAELHVYAGAAHGFGVRPANGGAVAGWIDRFREWLETVGMVKRRQVE
jgi:acetyl esterase/lipase